jgi:hypothetical protein
MCVHGFLKKIIYLFFTFLLCLCSSSFTFSFEHIFFSQVTKVLSIASHVVPPFQKVCENCHVTNVTISLVGGVYCNTRRSKLVVQKLSFLHGSIATNDEHVLLTIKGK